MTVKEVVAQLRPSAPGETGEITIGYYVVDRDKLTMTYPDGEPVDEYLYRHRLLPNDNEKTIAAMFTKQIRTAALDEKVPGFTRSLSYPKLGVA
jgi:hypothetical protein